MSDSLALDTPEELQRLEEMIAAEEAADAAAAASSQADAGKPSPNPDAADRAAADPDGYELARMSAPKEQKTDNSQATDPTAKPDGKDAVTKPDADNGKANDDKAKSRYAKELERQDRSWKALNERKAEVERREQELARREQEVAQAKAKAETPKFTADQYERAAKSFEEQGKYDLAEAARERAKELRENPQAEAGARAAQVSQEHQQRLESSWAKVKQDMPDALDKRTAFNAKLLEFIKAEPDVMGHPNGPYLAAQFVKAQLAAAQAETWRKEVETLTAKVKELEARVSVPGVGLNRVPSPKAFDEMDVNEQERELDRMYRETVTTG